tara:strand:+ start:230 stop:943 length:714 start_codon:yes stop_codon:yes gene_type:complete
MSNFNYTDMAKDQFRQKIETTKAIEEQKAEFEKKAEKRGKRKAKRKEKRATMFAGAVEAFASGLQAEGLRRHKMGLSGAGFAEAFAAGVGDVVDFSKLQRARKKSAIAQKLGFVPAESDSVEEDLVALVNALTKGEGTKNSQMAVDPKIDVKADGVEDKPGPFEQDAPQDAGEPNDQKVLENARDQNQKPPETPKTGNPVINNILTPEEIASMGLREESPGVFVDFTGQVVDVRKPK